MYKLNISSCFVEAKIKKINLFLTKTVVSLESCKNILFSTFLSQYRMKTNANQRHKFSVIANNPNLGAQIFTYTNKFTHFCLETLAKTLEYIIDNYKIQGKPTRISTVNISFPENSANVRSIYSRETIDSSPCFLRLNFKIACSLHAVNACRGEP